jgi:PAS domain S-box-containing protein
MSPDVPHDRTFSLQQEKGAFPGLVPILNDFCPDSSPAVRCPSLTSILSLLQKMPALLWTTDRNAAFTSLAGAGLDAIGVSAGDVAGRSVDELFLTSEFTPTPRQAHLQALRGQASSFHCDVGGHDLQAHLEPLRGADGTITGVIGVALDLTERMVAERALRLSEHSYRSLIEEAPYAICRCTIDGQLLQVNRAMLDMLGYDPDAEADLLIRDMNEIFVGSFPELRAALLEGRTVNGMETVWLPRDGNLIQVVISGRSFRDRSGQISLLNILAEDVTGKKLLEEQLYQAQKMQAVGQLAGGVAHDFNNLLTVIAGNVELMLNGSLDQALRDRLARVQQATDRAAKLTRQLLAYSRRQTMQTRVIDLNQVIDHLLGMLRRLIKENVELTFLPGADLGRVKADPHQIEQVLINLTVNAQAAMPDGGQFIIETRNLSIGPATAFQAEDLGPGDYVQLLVRDTGHGMDRQVQARAFEPFFTTKQTGEGTGLGLSMAYGIVTQSGGTIRLESSPGAGCVFWITLPRTEGAIPEALPSAPVPLIPRGSETILLAEDESDVRELIESYLRNLGYTVLAVADGLDGVALAHTYPDRIHLLLSDLVMPKMGGHALASTLKRMIPQVKVIFLSGYAGHTVAEENLEITHGRFLAKPLSMEALARAVREALDEPHT